MDPFEKSADSTFLRCNGVTGSSVPGIGFEEISHQGDAFDRIMHDINWRQNLDPDELRGKLAINGQLKTCSAAANGECALPVLIAGRMMEMLMRAVTGYGLPATVGDSDGRDIKTLLDWKPFQAMLGEEFEPFRKRVDDLVRQDAYGVGAHASALAKEAEDIARKNLIRCPHNAQSLK